MRVTGKRLCLAVALVAAASWPRVTFAASTITGTVTFDGKAPALKPLAMDADPACAKKHTAPAPSEMLVLGSANSMANVMVYVYEGGPGRQDVSRSQDAGGSRSERLSVRPARDGDHGRSALQNPQFRWHPP